MKACYLRMPLQIILTICEYLMPAALISSVVIISQALFPHASSQLTPFSYMMIEMSGIWIILAWHAWAQFSWNYDVFEAIDEQQLFQPDRLDFEPKTWVFFLTLFLATAIYCKTHAFTSTLLIPLEIICAVQFFFLGYLTAIFFLIRRRVRRYTGSVKYMIWDCDRGGVEDFCTVAELKSKHCISETTRRAFEQERRLFKAENRFFSARS